MTISAPHLDKETSKKMAVLTTSFAVARPQYMNYFCHFQKRLSPHPQTCPKKWLFSVAFLGICLSRPWLIFTHAKNSEYLFSSLCFCPVCLCMWVYAHAVCVRMNWPERCVVPTPTLRYTHQAAHGVLSVSLARLLNNKPGPLCLSSGSTHCSIVFNDTHVVSPW